MGIPRCGECSKRLPWWKVFKDLSYGSLYKKRKIECSQCGTKNMRIIWQHFVAAMIFPVVIATVGTFFELGVFQSFTLVAAVLIGGLLLLPFIVAYEPAYLPEEYDGYQ
jgi:CXXC-20-CXXC protein